MHVWHVHMHICIYNMYIHICMHVHMYIYICIDKYTYMYIRTFYMHRYWYWYWHRHCRCIYICYTNTHTHTHKCFACAPYMNARFICWGGWLSKNQGNSLRKTHPPILSITPKKKTHDTTMFGEWNPSCADHSTPIMNIAVTAWEACCSKPWVLLQPDASV